MIRILLLIKAQLDKLGKWFGSLEHRGRRGYFTQWLVIICGFLTFVILLPGFSGIVMIYFPRFTAYLMLACVIIPSLVILFTPMLLIMKVSPFLNRMAEEIWTTGYGLSLFLLFFSVLLGFFDTGGIAGLQRLVFSKFFTNQTQFPLSEPSGFAVDSNENLYLAIPAYSRIQVYTSSGDFLKGWFVDTAGGSFDIWVEGKNIIHSCTVWTDRHDVFDANGNLLETTQITSFDEDVRLFDKAGGLKELIAHGNTYSVREPEWNPRLIKINSDGRESVIVQDPFHLRLLQKMQPLLLFVLAGIILGAILGLITKFNVDYHRINTKPRILTKT
ncbi:MAG: hypothetical protein ACYSR9_09790 [Planctomycetota bacterium]|jgi:hypothetical protein